MYFISWAYNLVIKPVILLIYDLLRIKKRINIAIFWDDVIKMLESVLLDCDIPALLQATFAFRALSTFVSYQFIFQYCPEYVCFAEPNLGIFSLWNMYSVNTQLFCNWDTIMMNFHCFHTQTQRMSYCSYYPWHLQNSRFILIHLDVCARVY